MIMNVILAFLLLVSITVLVYLYFVYIPNLKRTILGADENDLRETVVSLEAENAKLKGELDEKNNLISGYESNIEEFLMILDLKPNFNMSTDAENNEAAENFIKCVIEKYPKGASIEGMKEYFDRQRTGIEAYRIIKLLQTYMNNVQMELQRQDTPLDDECKKANLISILDMAMVAFDYITPFHNINAREEQKLNQKILEGLLSRNEALSQAKQITKISTETPKWLRVIKESVEYAGINEPKIIFSGYKL